MKLYYYIENDQRIGSLSIEALKANKKSTLVWTDGIQDWDIAENLDGLKHVLIAEPPPIPIKAKIEQRMKQF